MEPLSQTDGTPESRRILEAQLRELFGRVVYSHKTQEKCADILLHRHSLIKSAQIALLVIVTGGSVSVLFGFGAVGAIISSVFSALLLAMSLYTKSHDLGEIAQRHRQAAADIWLIREKYLSLITDLRVGGKPIEALQRERDILLDDLHSVYSGSPGTWSRAYNKAQSALKRDDEMTFSDEEIDAFLPEELRRANQALSSGEVAIEGTGPRTAPPKADSSVKPPGASKPKPASNPPQQSKPTD